MSKWTGHNQISKKHPEMRNSIAKRIKELRSKKIIWKALLRLNKIHTSPPYYRLYHIDCEDTIKHIKAVLDL